MDLGKPLATLLPRIDADVLKVLFGRSTPATGREIARLADASHMSVARSLSRLVEQGIVDRYESGASSLFTLNRDHLVAPAVELLARLRPTLLARLREEAAGWELPPTTLSLFGSGARGDGGTESDIDLLLVRPIEVSAEEAKWQGQVDDLTVKAERWTGNAVKILEYEESDLRSLGESAPLFREELLKDAITVYGRDLKEITRADE